MEEIFKHMALAGDTVVLYVLMAASILSVGVIIGRWRVFARNRGDLPGLLHGMASRLGAHDIGGAIALMEASPRVEARVALEGLKCYQKGAATVDEVMTSCWLQEKLLHERNLIVLGTLGNNAPFIGLFGTVLGIIKAFNDLALSGQSGVAVVMSGISGALIATAFGILVAIPAVVANNYFVTKLGEIQANTDSLARILLGYLKEEGQR